MGHPGTYQDAQVVWHIKRAGLNYFTVKGQLSPLDPHYVINNVPLVIAHSVIPTFSSSGSNHAILRLGKKPLGAVLFAKSRKHSKPKYPRDIARLDKSSALWKKCSQYLPGLSSPLWARRTLYRLKGHPILVNEIFLPELLQY
jgi:chorismate--pyruvate lyase